MSSFCVTSPDIFSPVSPPSFTPWSNSSSNGWAIKLPSPHRPFLCLPPLPSTMAPIKAPPPRGPPENPAHRKPLNGSPLLLSRTRVCPHQAPPTTTVSPGRLAVAHPPMRPEMGSPIPSPPWLVPLCTRAVGGQAPMSSVASVHGRPTVDQGSGGSRPRGLSLQGFPL
jgi:hypothetical protein